MNRCYLLTGGSGVIGSAVLPVLLEKPHDQVLLLLRASSALHLQSRFDELCSYWGISEEDSRRSRIIPMRGDVKRASLGLHADDYARVCGMVTHIIHAAGNVRMNLSIDEARSETLSVAKNVVNVFKDCKQNNKTVKLDYVSTIGVCGKMSGNIPEERISNTVGFNNSYEQSKYESESLLWDLIEAGEAVTLHRPSMVVGHSDTGRIKSFQVFYYLADFLSGRHTFGVLPHCRDHQIDLIPVDYVAQAIAISSWEVTSVGRVFHLCSGHNSPNLGNIIDEVGTRSDSRLTFIPVRLFRCMIFCLTIFTSQRYRRKLSSLSYFLSYLHSKQIFSTACSHAYFESHGLKLRPWRKFVQPVLNYYWDG